jgi:uncharacterized protein
VIAVDTNILIYAHRADSPWHGLANRQIAALAEGRSPWAIPWACLHEFIAIVTHPRIYAPPSRTDAAFDQLSLWTASPSLRLIGETENHFDSLKELALGAKLVGPKLHDAKIAVLCLQHGVTELWPADRDFLMFPALKTRNPLVS